MPRHINKMTVRGNLGQDPKAFGENGCELSVATTDKWKDKQTGQPQESTEWHKVVVFGHSARFALEYMKKGYMIEAEGKMRYRKWQDNNGQDRVTPEIVINNGMGNLDIIVGDRQPQGGYAQQGQNGQQPQGGYTQQGQNGQPPHHAQAQQPAQPPQAPPGFAYEDDDVPF